VHLASLLPQMQRMLMVAYLEKDMTVAALAALHRTTPRMMRRRLEGLRETLTDPFFLVVARSAACLPAELASLARARWLEGRALRELAILRGQTLHCIRQQLDAARVLLQNVDAEMAPRSAARLSLQDEGSK
jgi:type II secretory pathway component PulJ